MIMFASSERESPCRARDCFSSSGRMTETVPSSSLNEMPAGKSRVSSPFGPFTLTVEPLMSSWTVFATGIGSLPIRDIVLPHVTDDFAADAAPPCVLPGHDALRGREDRDPQAAVHAGDLSLLHVDAQARLADALQSVQHRLFLAGVGEMHAHQ